MNAEVKAWVDIISKVLGAAGIFIAALNYHKQGQIKRGEWLKSLFEKFYENEKYKEVRRWLDSGELDKKVDINDLNISKEEELYTDFLNFFEFIAKLEADHHLQQKDVTDLFEYYLNKLKASKISSQWIEKYGFEKLRNLLNRI